MRSARSLLVLLVLAVGLGAYIYLVEMKRDPNAGTAKAKVFSVESANITQVDVHASSGDVTSLKKTGDTWAIESPIKAKADDATVTSLLDALASMDVDRALDDNPTSLAQYGLEPPRYTVVFRTTDAAEHRLEVGDKTPTGSDVYARVGGQPRLFLTPAFHGDSLNRSTFDLRDKHVLAFSRDAVDTVTIDAAGQQAVQLARTGSDWKLTAPLAAPADFSPVDGLLGRLDQVRMQSVVEEGSEPTPAELKTWGLDAPRLTVTLGSGSSKATLALGTKKDETSVYARDLSRPLVFTVEAALVTDLTKQPSDLRVKDVFEARAYTATGFDITHGATSASYVKTKATGGDAAAQDTWKQTKPAEKDANATALTDLLNTLTSLRVDHFVDKAPASGDDLVVVMHVEEGTTTTTEHVTLRKAGGTTYAIRERQPDAGVVPTADFDKAVGQLQTLLGAK